MSVPPDQLPPPPSVGQMTLYYSALFSMLDGPITQAQRDALANLDAQWVLINHRNGRFLIDIVGPKKQLAAIRRYLVDAGRDPIVIGVWDCDGNVIQSGQLSDWLNVAEDVVTYDASGNVASITRPVAFRSTNEWAGWAARTALA